MKLKFFHFAKDLTQYSDYHQHKVGCVIVKKNRVISFGYNKRQTHPKSTHKFHYLHAEVDALLKIYKASWAQGCIAYVYRQTRDGSLGLAKPCAECQKALKKAGIKKVFFTTKGSYDCYLV